MLTRIYYHLKPAIPRALQIHVRRKYVARKRAKCADIWPIDESAAVPPGWWKGWQENKQFALVLTHDVETGKGQEKCHSLAEMDKKHGFRSCFNFVPERYAVSSELREYLVKEGFEVGVHDLYHDGKLYNSRKIFLERAQKINKYLREWGAAGFRSGSMHHNLEWIHDLDIEYDSSTFDTDPFEPQAKGTGTIFPFHVNGNNNGKGYVELPYTLPQDFTLFIMMQEKNIDIWKQKLDWIASQGGMALVAAHPDYINFSKKAMDREAYPAEYYQELLEYIKSKYNNKFWHVLPRDVSRLLSGHINGKSITY